MSDVIPIRRVMELLRDRAVEAFGFQAAAAVWGVKIMCKVCYPGQPERLQYAQRRNQPTTTGLYDRRAEHWLAVLRDECDGYILIRYPHMPDEGRVFVEDAVDALIVRSCCHDEDNALGGWYWRQELAWLIEQELESNREKYEAEWEESERRSKRAREAARAHQEAVNAAYTFGQQIAARQRVQAVAAVLKAQGRQVMVEQARLSFECGHVSELGEGRKGGEFERIVIIVNTDGMPVRGYESCTQHEDVDVIPDIAVVAAEYARVAEMTPDERAAYKPVPETRAGGRGGPPWRKGGARTKAEPKPQRTPEANRAWFIEHDIDPGLPVQKLFAKAKEVGGDHPPRAAIEVMKRALRPE